MRPIFAAAAMLLATAVLAVTTSSPRADDAIVITIKDHKFTPTEVKVPAGKRVVLTVVNDDATPEEFESKAMKVEKVIAGKSQATVRIGPLDKGRYDFIGEFNQKTAQGTVTAE